jgi:hypothetical protein
LHRSSAKTAISARAGSEEKEGRAPQRRLLAEIFVLPKTQQGNVLPRGDCARAQLSRGVTANISVAQRHFSSVFFD